MPAFIEDDGTKRNQADAILHYLCEKYGSKPATAEEMYEMHWYFEAKRDHEKREFFGAITTENCAEDIIDKFVANSAEMHAKCEARWADGRNFVAGNNITAADYVLLAGFTMFNLNDFDGQGQGNTGLRNPSILTKMREQMGSNSANTIRIINNIRAQCQGAIDALQPSWI